MSVPVCAGVHVCGDQWLVLGYVHIIFFSDMSLHIVRLFDQQVTEIFLCLPPSVELQAHTFVAFSHVF